MEKRKEEIFSEWINRRQSVSVPERFDAKVMDAVARQKVMRSIDMPIALRFFTSRPVQWAAALGAVMLGLFRLSYITTALLVP